jgi:catechol 1,2-dioxygenase
MASKAIKNINIMKKNSKKASHISRKEFIIKSTILAGTTILIPRIILGQECYLTTDDILGPYFVENAPIRAIIAHSDEPGQRLFVSGRILQDDCETPISGAMVEVWHANDAGCYSINLDCTTGNPGNDDYNLRGKMFSNESGHYAFETILPGYYASRPKHIHIKITTPNQEVLITQIYFEGDPLCETDSWCQDAEDRILVLEEDNLGLHGELDFNMNSAINGVVLGDVNFDGNINIQDILIVVGIVLGSVESNDFQMYAADVNGDTNIDILDIITMLDIILGTRQSFQPLIRGEFKIDSGLASIDAIGEVAGIQLFTKGDFKIKKHNLPSDWAFHYSNNIILIFNQGDNKIVPKQLFEFEGNMEIISNIITGWDAQRLEADINLDIQSFHLSSPHPNPFNPTTNIVLNQNQNGSIKIIIYDIKGRELKILFDGIMQPGRFSFTWDATIYPTGVYFVKAISKNQKQVKKIMLIK